MTLLEESLQVLKCTDELEKSDFEKAANREPLNYLDPSTPCIPQEIDSSKQTFVPNVTIHPSIIPFTEQIIRLRRQLHQYPEYSLKEWNTHSILLNILQEVSKVCDLQIRELKTIPGIVAWISGTGIPISTNKYCIGFRCDMDALPVSEPLTAINKNYASVNSGYMHACGHDGHMAILTYAQVAICQPSYLSKLPSNLIIKFFFQPAEEEFSGGHTMVNMGVLEETSQFGPYVDEVYGLHLISSIPYGISMSQRGCILAAARDFDITIQGHSGHAGVPHTATDAAYIAANLLVSIQSIMSRNVQPSKSAVVSIGKVVAGEARNAIAGEASLYGTIRSNDQQSTEIITERIQQLCDGLSIQYNCKTKFEITDDVVATVNNPVKADQVASILPKIFSNNPGAVISGDAPPLNDFGAEDFAFFLQARPGSYTIIGSGIPGALRENHNYNFDIDERSLPASASVYLYTIEKIVHDMVSKV